LLALAVLLVPRLCSRVLPREQVAGPPPVLMGLEHPG
jgi:hypothetical protein